MSADQNLVHLPHTDAVEEAAELRRYSLGRLWDEQTALSNIQRATAIVLDAVVEIGRNLLWAKACLPHGTFDRWCAANIPFSKVTAQRYMAIAETFLERPTLLQNLRGVGVKKAMLLTQLDPELLSAIEDGAAPNLTPADVAKSSYADLKTALRQAQAEAKEANRGRLTAEQGLNDAVRTAEQLTTKNQRLTEQLAAFNGVALSTDAEARATVDRVWAEFNAAMGRVAWDMDNLCSSCSSGGLSTETQAHIQGVAEGMRQRLELEALRWTDLRGGVVLGADWARVKDGEVAAYPTPPSRWPTVVDD